jgi:asparagine synthase (glutamine-hydrolysing)
MCGIAGFTHLDRRADPARIASAIDLLVHRGPDEQRTYSSRNCSLAAARLSIIDVPHGQQPMADDASGSVLAFNGEIYNHAELRQELESFGHQFHTRSDTEVVLRAFLQWDTACFSRLRGMFAIALWSNRENRLVLARDRVGIKPLYVHLRNRDIYFASEIKSLLIHPEIDRNLSLDALNLYLTLNYVPGELTLIEGIRKLAPGSWMEWRAGTVREERYWELNIEPTGPANLADAASQLDEILRQSVREHLISDVPVGVWLSGGIDSSTILHYAAGESSRPLNTFSVTFRGKSFDESRFIREMSERYGTEHHEIDLNSSADLPGAVEELTYYSDEPCSDSGALPVWFLSRLTGSQVRVALSGDGADELFGGYTTYLADSAARGLRRLPPSFLRMARRVAQYWPVSDEKVGLEYCVKRLLAGSHLPASEAHIYWNGTFTASERTPFFPSSSPEALRGVLSSVAPQENHNGSMAPLFAYDCRYYLTDDILAKVDRMSMAHSVEVRPPFLDHRIVEFSAGLPDSFKIKGLQQKRILRELMKHKLPAAVLRRKKIGFDIPTHEWFRGPLRSLLLDTLNADAVRDSGLFRWEPVQAMMQAHFDRRANIGFHLWGLVALFIWMKQWNVHAGELRADGGQCSRAVAVS